MSRGLELVFLPGISCYMALVTADCALGDDSLKLLADTLKQIMTTALKFLVIGFTAYLSITGVISGSADSAAIRAAKLTISTAVPVVGSMIADASETLLVSAGMVRGSLGVLGLLGLLAVSIGPFLQDGVQLSDAPLYRCRRCCHGRKEAVRADFLHGRGGGAYYGQSPGSVCC